MDQPILMRNTDGSLLVTQGGQELGTVRPVLHGQMKGQFEFESFLALPAQRRGYAPSERGALYHLGFKVVGKNSGSLCYPLEEE